MSLRKSILLSLFACTTLQATEFPNGMIPADIAAEFAGGGTLLQGLPGDFPPITLPPGLDLGVVGTHQRSQYQQTILLRSTHGIDDLRDRLLTALTVQGWQELGQAGLSLGNGYLQLCHDTYGSMTVSMRSSGSDAVTRVQVQRSVYPVEIAPVLSCAEQRQRNVETTTLYNFYNSLLPLLEVPEGTLAPVPGIGIRGVSNSFSGSSMRIEREGTIAVPDTTAAEVYEHFAAQLEAQGWDIDSSATGDVSAASTWTRTVTPTGATTSELALLSLTVQAGTNDYYGVALVLRTQPSPEAAGFSNGYPPF